MHIGTKNEIASHGVLYGISVYAANSPKAQRPVNMENLLRGRKNANPVPRAAIIMIGASTSLPHWKYAHIPFWVWSLLPVFVQIEYASNALLTPSGYVKNDEKKSTLMYMKIAAAAAIRRMRSLPLPSAFLKFAKLSSEE